VRPPWAWWRSKNVSRAPVTDETAVSAPGQKQVIDSVIDAYIDWREECAALEYAYLRWAGADALDAELAFAEYMTRLDREERASALYAELLSAASPTSSPTSRSPSP
jgi:hypothetical protein